MAGYDGYSKSNNAADAEDRGLYPLTIAASKVSKAAGVTVKVARQTLEELGPEEWHHTSCKYNRTYYYSVEQAVSLLRYGDQWAIEDASDEQEAAEAEQAHREKLAKQAACTHDWEPIYFMGKGGVMRSEAHHYRCRTCRLTKGL